MRSRKDVDFSNRGRIDLSLSQISMIFRWSTSNRRRIDNRFLAGLIPDAKKKSNYRSEKISVQIFTEFQLYRS